MGYTERILNKFGFVRHKEIVQKESQAQGLDYATWEATQGVTPPTTQDLLDCNTASDMVYRAVKVRGEAISGVPIRFWQGKSDQDKEEITDGPATLLEKPNPNMTGKELLQITMAHLDLIGYAFWEKACAYPDKPVSPRNPVLELHPLMPTRTYLMRDKKRGIFAYRQWSKYMDDHVDFDPDKIVMFRYRDPQDIDGYGLSPLTAARRKLALELNATAYNQKFFENGAEPAGLLIKKTGRLQQTDIDRIGKAWKQAHGTSEGKAHRIGILDEDMDYKQIGLSQKDMQFLEMAKWSGEASLRCYGVNPAIVGILDLANYSNIVEIRRMFWTQTLFPVMEMLSGQVDLSICGEIGPNVWCDFDMDQIQDLRDDEDKKADRASKLTGGSPIFLTNEIRKSWYGLPKVPWGDEPWIPGQGPLSLVASGVMPAIVPAKMLKAYSKFGLKKLYSEDEQKAIWEAFVKRLDRHEVEMKKGAAKYFKGQVDRIIAKLDSGTKATHPHNWLTDASSEFWDIENIGAYDELNEYIRDAIKRGIDVSGEDYGGSGPDQFSWTDPTVVRFLRNKKIKLGKDINPTTIEKLTTIIADSSEAGESIQQLSKRIRDYYDEMEGYRSERIARTETSDALNAGVLRGFELSGFAGKSWLAQKDKFCRETHRDANDEYMGKPIPVKEPFRVGGFEMMRPGDTSMGAPLDETINCRCGLVPVAEL